MRWHSLYTICILPLATLILIPMEDIFMEKKKLTKELYLPFSFLSHIMTIHIVYYRSTLSLHLPLWGLNPCPFIHITSSLTIDLISIFFKFILLSFLSYLCLVIQSYIYPEFDTFLLVSSPHHNNVVCHYLIREHIER